MARNTSRSKSNSRFQNKKRNVHTYSNNKSPINTNQSHSQPQPQTQTQTQPQSVNTQPSFKKRSQGIGLYWCSNRKYNCNGIVDKIFGSNNDQNTAPHNPPLRSIF